MLDLSWELQGTVPVLFQNSQPLTVGLKESQMYSKEQPVFLAFLLRSERLVFKLL